MQTKIALHGKDAQVMIKILLDQFKLKTINRESQLTVYLLKKWGSIKDSYRVKEASCKHIIPKSFKYSSNLQKR